jgi:tripartite-type tricarboxylate transporter receptor subunit TctC
MRTIMRSRFIDAGAALLLLATAAPALAQQPVLAFPAGKPIEMTVMFGAGSAADVTARYLADGMAKLLGVCRSTTRRSTRWRG